MNIFPDLPLLLQLLQSNNLSKGTLFPITMPVKSYFSVLISQVKGELQVGKEVIRELRIHIQHLKQVFPVDGVQIAVAQSSHICY